MIRRLTIAVLAALMLLGLAVPAQAAQAKGCVWIAPLMRDCVKVRYGVDPAKGFKARKVRVDTPLATTYLRDPVTIHSFKHGTKRWEGVIPNHTWAGISKRKWSWSSVVYVDHSFKTSIPGLTWRGTVKVRLK